MATRNRWNFPVSSVNAIHFIWFVFVSCAGGAAVVVVVVSDSDGGGGGAVAVVVSGDVGVWCSGGTVRW